MKTSPILEYLHLIICFFMILFAITQRYYCRKAYHNKNYVKQYKIVNIITAIIMFILIVVAICKTWIF
jgi:putative copper export protein